MRIIKHIILGALLISNLISFGQSKLKGNVMIGAGISKSDLYNKLFILSVANKNGLLYPKSQSAEPFLDLNINYFFKNNVWKLKPMVGFGYSPQGFSEKGVMYNDSQKLVDYTLHLKMDFISIYGGFSYKFLSNKWLNIRFNQTINPMIDMNKTHAIFKKIAASTRSNLLFEYKLKNGGVACISPFFQTCIFKFNNSKKIAGSPDYFPYSYGINIGTYFKH